MFVFDDLFWLCMVVSVWVIGVLMVSVSVLFMVWFFVLSIFV